MSYPLIIRPDAENDLAEARQWYDQQRKGLGDEFVLCVEEALERIGRTPEIHADIYRGLRRTSIRRFPYGVYYRFENERVIVAAVMHGRRNPRRWQGRA